MRRRSPSLPYRLVARIIAVALLGLGVPQTGATLLRLYAAAVPSTPFPTEAAAAAAALHRIDLLKRADQWFGDPDARISAALFEFRIANRQEQGGSRDPRQLAEAIADFSSGLARAPANPFGWIALGDARMEAGDRRGAAKALRASILFGAYELPLSVPRAELGLALWPQLDGDEREEVAQQIRLAWRFYPQELVAVAKRSGAAFPAAIALAREPAQLSAFLRALAAR